MKFKKRVENFIADIGIGSAMICVIGAVVILVEGLLWVIYYYHNNYQVNQGYLTQRGVDFAQQDIENILLLMKYTGVTIMMFFVIFVICALYFHFYGKDE